MPALSLSFLGTNWIFLNGQPVEAFHSIKVQALLNYLAAEHNSAHRREELMALLWPGMPDRSARHNLRNVIYHLRKSLPELAGKPDDAGSTNLVPLLITNRQTIQINPAADIERDVDRFEQLIDSIQSHNHLDLFVCHQCREDLQAAVAVYQGDFLADFFLDDSEPYEEWTRARRDYYRRKILDALETLTTMHMRQKDYAGARAYAERQLEIDDLREISYRQLMEILALSGQRSEALAVHDAYRRLLLDELGMEPSAQTTELYNKIQGGDLTFDAPPDQAVRGYELKDEIGRGAFGAIHRAVQPSVDREVAIKVIRRKYANDAEFIRRFDAEAQTVAHLEHPYIVPLYDYWRDPDGAYLVMRYLRGGNLLSALESGPWDAEPTMMMLDQLSSALAAAHQQGVVHRDIKPANILFDENGNAYLADFGIAKDLTVETQMTAAGAMMGTPDYSSPEQILGERVGPESDLYSLGAVLYETLTGERPFPDSSLASLLHKQLNEAVPFISESRPDLPREVDTVIQRATAKLPADRFASVEEMAGAFRLAILGAQPERPVVVHRDGADVVNPYKGLRAFQEFDAADFFGREKLVEQLVDHLSISRFLAVVGPSGSGKSSVVKAGLIPALRQGVIKGSEKWFVAEMVPGSQPFEELELALLPVAVDPPPNLIEPMRKDQRGLLRTIRRILPDEDGAHLLLVIDQFEELFTLVDNEEERASFLDSLLAAIMAPHSPLQVVITLRADFYDRPLQVQPLGQWIKENTEIVLPMSADELTWAIDEPVRRIGVGMEEGLVPAIVAEVNDEPGALPLMQYAMTELFEKRKDGLMTRDAYEEIGGVLGALGQRAEELYQSLDKAGRETARQLLLRLVTLGEGVEDTRRRVQRSELESIFADTQYNSRSEVAKLVDKYGQARLLTFDRDPATREPTVEVAHEALLREWGRLRHWLDEGRADIRLQRLLAVGAAEWQATGQDPGFLLRGSRLDQFEDWAKEPSVALTPDERGYLAASLEARRERRAAEEARRQRELETAQQLAETEHARAEEQEEAAAGLRRRAYVLGGVLVVALLLALAAFFFARESNANALIAEQNAQTADENAANAQKNAQLAETREAEAIVNAELASASEANAVAEAEQRATAQAEADEQRNAAVTAKEEAVAEANIRAAAEAAAIVEQQKAEEQAQIAVSRELAAAALSNLDSDPERAILLALQGLNTRHTFETENALHRSIQASPLRDAFVNEGIRPIWTAASSDGRFVFASGENGGTMWDIAKGEVLFTRTVPDGDWINNAEFSPDGSLLVMPGESWDGDDSLPGTVTIVESETGQILAEFDAHDAMIQDVAVSPDGQLFATVSEDLNVKIWDLETTLEEGAGVLIQNICCLDDWANSADFSPDSTRLATATGWDYAKVWDVATGEEVFAIGPGIAHFAHYSPDGEHLVTSGQFGNIDIWDATTGEKLSTTIGHSGNFLTFADFSPDGSHIVSISNDGSLSLWLFSPEGLQETQRIHGLDTIFQSAAFSPDGQTLFTSNPDNNTPGTTPGTTRVWDISLTGSAEITAFPSHDLRNNNGNIIRGGSQLVTSGLEGMLKVWDTQTWEQLSSIQAHDDGLTSMDVSPDDRWVATASQDATTKLWDSETWQLEKELTGHERLEFGQQRGVMDVRFSHGSELLATAGADGVAIIWDVATGQPLHYLEGGGERAQAVAFSPDDRLLAVAESEIIKIWDVSTGQELLSLVDESPAGHWGLEFTPDGLYLLSGESSGEIEMWRLPADLRTTTDADALLVYNLLTGAGWTGGGSFSPDGERIAVHGLSGQVEIRDAKMGELLTILQHPAGVSYAKFTPDGKNLTTGGRDGITRVFVLDLEELIELGQSRTTRSLTEEECREYLHMDACPATNAVK